MHLPDGFLDGRTALLSTAAAGAGISVALRRVRASLGLRQAPKLGLAAAFVFVAQMLNFPIVGGTSGHVVGGVLAAVLLGPSAAIIVMTCVLVLQCLMFADGGILALGANIFNMAIVNVCGGWFAFRLVKRLIGFSRSSARRSAVEATHAPNGARGMGAPQPSLADQRATVFAAGFAAWFATVLSSICCAGELALSKTAPWSVTFPAMANVHMLIGVGEAIATAFVVAAVRRTRPELAVNGPEGGPEARVGLVAYGLLLCAGLAIFVAPFACPWPDGLESVARSLGFAAEHPNPLFKPPLSEYHLPLFGSTTAATAAAALIGTLIAFISSYTLARALVPGKRKTTDY